MKNLRVFTLVLSLMAIALGMNVQAQEAPKNGFRITFQPEVTNLKAGESQTVTASILRSKRFSKTNIDLRVLPLPQGLTIELNKQNADQFELVIKADASVPKGNYTATILGKTSLLSKSHLIEIQVQGKGGSVESSN